MHIISWGFTYGFVCLFFLQQFSVYCSFATESRHDVLSYFASTIFEATSSESMISERTQIYLWITIYSSGSNILFCQPFKLLVILHMCAWECEQSCLCAGWVFHIFFCVKGDHFICLWGFFVPCVIYEIIFICKVKLFLSVAKYTMHTLVKKTDSKICELCHAMTQKLYAHACTAEPLHLITWNKKDNRKQLT